MSEAVFHLTEPEAWAEAQREGHLSPASLASEGFVHCSTAEQLVGTIQRHFPSATVLVLLELDPTDLGADLRWEESRPGETYPHLFRSLDPSEVRRAVRWERAADGSVTLPSELTGPGSPGS